MTLGFTGTSRSSGMTQRQHDTVRYLFIELQLRVLHHGCCINADAQAHRMALELGALIVGHPPADSRKQDLTLTGFWQVREPLPYLARDRAIVAEAIDGLIGAPKSFVMPSNLRGQGTWYTVNQAHEAKRRVWLVFPDGTFREEKQR